MRAIRSGLQGAGIPVENSKGEWGPGQEEINVRYADALDDGRPPRHPEERRQGDRPCAGQGRHLHGEVATTTSPARPSHIHTSLWDKAGKTPLFHDAKAEHGMSDADAQLRRRAARSMRATSPISSRPTSIPTSASRPAPSRRPRRSGAATTAPPASGCAARAPRRSASSAASAAPTSIPISPSRR